jgi:hypothetical protein
MKDELYDIAKIDESEDIARIIFSPSMIEDGKVSASAFFMDDLMSGPEEYVSVWRLKYRVPSMDNVKFSPRHDGDKLVGYATLNVSACHKTDYIECKAHIKPHPSKRNSAHAGIHYTKGACRIIGKCQNPDFLMLTTILANICTLNLFKGENCES